MKKAIYAFKPFLSEIAHDFMLAACIVSPIIMGIVFRFLLPVIEKMLCNHFYLEHIFSPYYIIFDLLFVIMTPIMFCFSGVMVMLEEFDNGLTKYFTVTPLGKSGYLFSRLGIPTVLAFIYNIILLFLFTISGLDFMSIVVFAFSGGLMAVITSLIVVTFAKNKMEGMALIKLCGLLIIGIPIAYFVEGPIQYIFAIFPSFWLAKLSIQMNYFFFIPTAFTSLLLIYCLYGKYKKKLM